MAISTAPFALKNLGLDAEQLRQAVSTLLPNTGGVIASGDFAVTQTGTASMGVSVAIGRAWIAGTNVSNFTGTTYNKQGLYFALNDAPFTVTLTTADTVNPRIDLIYIGVQDKIYGATNDQIIISVVTGTPAATPAVPATPASAIALAQVAVAANATSVTNANITNYTLTTVATPTNTATIAKGLMAVDQTATTTTYPVSATTIAHAMPTFSFKAGRHYRIGWQFEYSTTGGTNNPSFCVGTCATTDSATAVTGLTTIEQLQNFQGTASQWTTINIAGYFSPSTDQTLQVKFWLIVGSGSSVTVTFTGSGHQTYTIEDLGAQF